MATVVIHRLQDWPVHRHLLPVLRAAGVPDAALALVHHFHAEEGADPFAALPGGDAFPEVADVLLAAGGALATLGHALVDTEEDDERTCGYHASVTEEQLQAAARKRKLKVVLGRDAGPRSTDGAGAALDALRASGVGEAELLERLRSGALGDHDDGSRDFALLGFFGRLDALLAAGEAPLRSLIASSVELPLEQQQLAGHACAALFPDDRLASLELATVKALSTLEHEGLVARAQAVFRRRVLAASAPPLADLLDVFDDADGELDAEELERFDQLWEEAVARDEHTLEQWVYALNRRAIDRATFDRGVPGPFRRAVAAGFRDEKGHGDRDGFAESARVVAAADPDLALAGFVALSSRFNENGLRALVADAKLLPAKGYSEAARSSAAAHFAQPGHRAAAKILAKVLATWGIEPKAPAPPALETIDVTCEVGTDVATLVVGSFEAVEAIAGTEDLDDCARVVRKTKSLGFATGGDGWFKVRVLGARDAKVAAAEVSRGATLLGVAPLRITGDALTVSGVVGGGGAPTIPFPSGTYAADVLGHASGPLALTIVIRKASKPPAWPFGKDEDLPGLV